MKVYSTYKSLKYIQDPLQVAADLDYEYALNKYCVDLKYAPTHFNYGLKVDYYVAIENYATPSTNKVYYLSEQNSAIFLPLDPPLHSTITLINETGWDTKIFSTCNDLYIKNEFYTYIELVFCGDAWGIAKKGTWKPIQDSSHSTIYTTTVRSLAKTEAEYSSYVFGFGYFNFADVYELYSLGLDPAEIENYSRYANNLLVYKNQQGVPGPILDNLTPTLNPFGIFKVWEFITQDIDMLDGCPENLKLFFDKFLIFDMPQVSGMLRDIKVKFTLSELPDSIYQIPTNSQLLSVFNISQNELMEEDKDYSIMSDEVVPTLRGQIYHYDLLRIELLGHDFVGEV
jgi:hypothetical protein